MNGARRMYRIEEGKKIAGVCGGVAEYFGLDPSFVRIIWAALCFAGSFGFWAYLFAALILPSKSELYPDEY